MATDFRALLQDTSETLEEAFKKSLLPEVWLIGKIGSHEFSNVRNEKQTPYVRFNLVVSEPHPNYLTDAIRSTIAEMDPPLNERKFNFDGFLASVGSKRHITQMLDRVVGQPNRTMESRIPETQGRTVMFKAVPQLDDSGKETGFSRVNIDDVHPFQHS